MKLFLKFLLKKNPFLSLVFTKPWGFIFTIVNDKKDKTVMELKHIDKSFKSLSLMSCIQAKYYQIAIILIIEAFQAFVISIFEKNENK